MRIRITSTIILCAYALDLHRAQKSPPVRAGLSVSVKRGRLQADTPRLLCRNGLVRFSLGLSIHVIGPNIIQAGAG